MKRYLIPSLIALALMAIGTLIMTEKKELIVGKDIDHSDITDFYYTVDSSAYPPEFQRFRFYLQDGVPYFYHETRQGDHWPLTEDDATAKKVRQLSDSQWQAFLDLIEAGSVTKRSEDASSGDGGPFLYLYWSGDRGTWQVYRFASYEKLRAFESYCQELKEG